MVRKKKREWWELPASQEPAVAPRVARRPGRFNTWSMLPATVPSGPSLRPPQDNRQFPPRREPREPPPADGAQEASEMAGAAEAPRPPLPPFETEEDALKKVKLAEQGWNSRDPAKVSLAYTPDSEWHVNGKSFSGREKIVEFLTDKWKHELDYRLEKTLWCFRGNRIAVVYRYEHHDAEGKWWRAHGNEDWEFAPNGLMQRRITQINKVPIEEKDRLFCWDRATHYA